MSSRISRPSTSPWPLLLALTFVPLLASRAESAVTADLLGTTLSVTGDAGANTITVRVAAGDATRLDVLDGTTVIGSFPRAGLTLINVQGLDGPDTILLSRVNGEITEPAFLNGGPGNDIMTGGAGDDTFFGGTENDRVIWNPGDGTDVVEGQAGNDTMEFNGSDGPETIVAAPNGLRVQLTRYLGMQVANTLDLGSTENLVLNGHGGSDAINAGAFGLAALVTVTIDGGDGNDGVDGSEGADLILGGNGNDVLYGRAGADIIRGGAGDDLIVWAPGFGNDTVDGEAGNDRLDLIGSDVDEQIRIGPNGAHVRVTRDVDMVTVDLDDVEVIQVEGRGGRDQILPNGSLEGTDAVSLILEGGDQNDTLIGNVTNDVLRGGNGVDQIDGGGGNDEIWAGPGNDTSVSGGDGDDTLFWGPGDGNDVLDGSVGNDKFFLYGERVNEVITITAIATTPVPRVKVTRDVETVVLDLLRTEQVEFYDFGGNDTVNVGPDLSALVTITLFLGEGTDILNTTASSTVIANGHLDTDTLNFDAGNRPVSYRAGVVTVDGVARVTFRDFDRTMFLNLPTALPSVVITSPTFESTLSVTTPFVTLAGRALDDVGVAAVTWVNDRGGTGTAAGTTDWTAVGIPLSPGANVITIAVRDTSGNQTFDAVTVTAAALTYTMAEGATGKFFDTDILIANPNEVTAPVNITYLRGDGIALAQTLDLLPTSRTTIAVDAIPGLENAEVSATVTSTAGLPLVVERTMRWDSTGYGAHTEKATDGPATTWYFAEGAQGFFDTYVLLANPGAASNTATVTFLLENAPPVTKVFELAPTSRRTIAANAIPELANQSFGTTVTFSAPGVAERAMYFGARVFEAGHESAGVNAPSTNWFLAEGATGTFFTTFVLLANPGAEDATATVTFLPASGAAVTKTKIVPAGRRVTLNIAAEDPSLADNAVATRVVSPHPILVERAQYWPFSPDRWYEAHNSFGGTTLATKWGLAEGRVGGPESYQTYILLANADLAQAAHVKLTFLRTNGTTVVKDVVVNPTSRVNVHVNSEVPELANESFGSVIQVTSGPGIFVERALYADSQGVVFAAGTNALATRLP